MRTYLYVLKVLQVRADLKMKKGIESKIHIFHRSTFLTWSKLVPRPHVFLSSKLKKKEKFFRRQKKWILNLKSKERFNLKTEKTISQPFELIRNLCRRSSGIEARQISKLVLKNGNVRPWRINVGIIKAKLPFVCRK